MRTIMILTTAFLSLALEAYAGSPPTLNYQGRIFDANGNPLQSGSVDFYVTISTPPSPRCVLYREVITVSMNGTDGFFNLKIGKPAPRMGGTGPEWSQFSLDEVFDNSRTFSNVSCNNGIQNRVMVDGEERILHIDFDYGSGLVSVVADTVIRSVPFALNARDADRVGGVPANNLLIQNTDGHQLTQTHLEWVFSDTNYDRLADLIDGVSNLYLRPGASGAIDAGEQRISNVVNPTDPQDAATMNYVDTQMSSSIGGHAVAPGFDELGTTEDGQFLKWNGTLSQWEVDNIDVDLTGVILADGSVPMTGQLLGINGTEGAPAYSFENDTDTGIFRSGTNTLAFSTGGEERIRVNSSGFVGIGTDNPIGILDVRGSSASSGDGAPIRLWAQHAGSIGTGGALRLHAGNASGTGPGGEVIINAGHGIGGGGVNPGGAVNISGGNSNGNNSGNNGGAVNLTGGNGAVGNASTGTGGAVTLVGGSGSAMGHGGDVSLSGGLGGVTSGDGGSVKISGGVPTNGTGGSINISAAAGVGTNRDGGNVTISSGAASGSGNPGSILLLEGSVGIGTTTPQARLDVAGGVRVSNDAAACVADKYGTIRYNSGNLQFCNTSNNWVTLGTGGGGDFSNGGDSFTANASIGTNSNHDFILRAHNRNVIRIGSNSRTTFGSSGATSHPANARHRFEDNPWDVSGDYAMISTDAHFNGSTTNTGTISGTRNYIRSDSTNSRNNIYGTFNSLRKMNSGNVSHLAGTYNFIEAENGPTSNIYGSRNHLNLMHSSTVTNFYGLDVSMTRPSGTATVTNAYGLYIGSLIGTNRWGVYQSGATDVNYFAGGVGIGVDNPSEKLDVDGDVRAVSFVSTSDRRLKTNIKDVDGLELIRRLRGVRFDWIKDGSSEIGLIAQEVEEVAPELVNTSSTTGIKSVKYSNLVAPLIESTKDLYEICSIQEERIGEVESSLNSLTRELASKADQAEVEALKAELAEKDKKIKELEVELKTRIERIEEMLRSK